jgi:ribonucleotide reductase alpha subunit
MERVENDEEWTLFCPSRAAHLTDLTGEDFETEYERLEEEGYGRAKISARILWREIIDSAVECGGPSILFKDTVNGAIRLPQCCEMLADYRYKLQ